MIILQDIGDYMKKLTSILLALLISASSVMTGCAENNNDDETIKQDAEVIDTVSSDVYVEERLYADVPSDAYFDGYTFNILCSSNREPTNTDYANVKNDFHAEEITGEAINDARYNRNKVVEDKLGIVIADHETATSGSSEGYTYITQDVQSGTGAYDIAACCGYATTQLSTMGYLCDMNEVPYLSLSSPWWDQVANESLQILDQLFFTTGDITTSDNDATYCILFNKEIITDYNMDNPYDLVYNGEWTIDKYIDLASQVSNDEDGNGKFDSADLYGVLIWDDSMMGIVNCTGGQCVSINNEGLMELTLNTEKTVEVVTKFLDFASQTQIAYAYQRQETADNVPVRMFTNNQALFFMQLIQVVPKLREMDTDFGILPYFKFDESQDKYYTTMGSWHSVFVCIPNSQKDVTRTGIITEVLANESHYELTDAYYEKSLKGRTTRDEESKEMLDIIFANRVYDLGWLFQIGEYNEKIMNLFRNYDNNFTSMYKGAERLASRLLQRTNDIYVDSQN